jgi:hypothetical protein
MKSLGDVDLDTGKREKAGSVSRCEEAGTAEAMGTFVKIGAGYSECWRGNECFEMDADGRPLGRYGVCLRFGHYGLGKACIFQGG